MSAQGAPEAESGPLAQLEAEHRYVLRALAVTVEQLLRATGGDLVTLSRSALAAARPLTALCDPKVGDLVLTVEP